MVILFLFLLNLGKIRQTIGGTNFKDIVSTQRGTGAPNAAPPAPAPAVPKGSGAAPAPGAGAGAGASAAGGSASPAAPGRGATPARQPQPVPLPAPQPAGRPGASGSPGGIAATPGAAASSQGGRTSPQGSGIAAARTRPTALYFIRIDNDGVIERQEVTRDLAVSDAPLTDALEALLKGPNEDELRKSLMTLVPLGTKLLGVEVHGSTAYVNFNEAFMYNHYGIEGYAGQLKQIVYTATSFPTVQDVQILINGQRHDYLGGEGVYIGKPLSRNSF